MQTILKARCVIGNFKSENENNLISIQTVGCLLAARKLFCFVFNLPLKEPPVLRKL